MKDEATKTCVVCGSQIPAKATICNVCTSYQASWKNHLRYAANVIGLFSVVFSAIMFIISAYPDVRKVVAWQDRVEVVSFNSLKPISVANLGDGEIFVTHIEITSALPEYYKSERIDQFIAPGATATVARSAVEFSHLSGYNIAVSSDEELREALLERAVSPHKTGCVVRVVAVPRDSGYLSYRKATGADMVTYEVEAHIQYYSIQKQEWHMQEVPLIGYLWIDEDNAACWGN